MPHHSNPAQTSVRLLLVRASHDKSTSIKAAANPIEHCRRLELVASNPKVLYTTVVQITIIMHVLHLQAARCSAAGQLSKVAAAQ
jgi:hypothetical protein